MAIRLKYFLQGIIRGAALLVFPLALAACGDVGSRSIPLTLYSPNTNRLYYERYGRHNQAVAVNRVSAGAVAVDGGHGVASSDVPSARLARPSAPPPVRRATEVQEIEEVVADAPPSELELELADITASIDSGNLTPELREDVKSIQTHFRILSKTTNRETDAFKLMVEKYNKLLEKQHDE